MGEMAFGSGGQGSGSADAGEPVDGAGLAAPNGWDRTSTEASVGVAVVVGRAGGDLAWAGGGTVAADDRGRPGSGAVDGEPGGARQWWPSGYRAAAADRAAWSRAVRPKATKLATSPALAGVGVGQLELDWSPQQIAGWLKTEFPDDGQMQVSHESIYRSLFVQARGSLRKKLTHSPADQAGNPSPGWSAATRRPRPAAGRSSTSPNAPPRQKTGPCPGTGKATWSSANT